MSAVVDFTIELASDEGRLFPELIERCKDLTPLFSAIIEQWAENNDEKFREAQGMELSGFEMDAEHDVTWEPLQSLSYAREKRRKGFPDWLMHRTGDLMASLSDEDRFFKAISDQQAVFGAPMDPEDEAKVGGNWLMRPAVFLDAKDRSIIYDLGQDFLAMRERFQAPITPDGMKAVLRRREEARFEAEFHDVAGGG